MYARCKYVDLKIFSKDIRNMLVIDHMFALEAIYVRELVIR